MQKKQESPRKKSDYEKIIIIPQEDNKNNFGVWEIPPNKKGIRIYTTTKQNLKKMSIDYSH